MHIRISVLALLAALIAGGCGSSSTPSSSTSKRTQTGTATSQQATQPGALAPAVSELPAAEHPQTSGFPSPRGRTLEQLATVVHSSAQLGPATGSFTPGLRRLAFALNTSSGAFIYAPTVIYIASGPKAHDVRGPIAAPADPTGVAPSYRSRQNAGPGGIQAIYEAQIPLPHAGTFAVLALTSTPKGLVGAAGEVAVAAKSPIPDVGQKPPAIATDTAATVHGNVSLLTTRIPPESMHSVSLDQVLGRRPVALLFSTPQLCVSKVCGPVTDLTVSLQKQFENRIAFIHEEVYVNNQPSQGLRPQMKAFHLQTEPWLFTINRHGVIAARLEGAFGVNSLRAALQAALR